MDNFLRRQVGQEEIPFNKIMRNSWKAMSNNIDPTNLTTLFTTEGDSSTKVRETFGNLASRLPLAKAAFTAFVARTSTTASWNDAATSSTTISLFFTTLRATL